MARRKEIRKLVVVLGDQLDLGSAALRRFDRERDVVWMAEVAGEATHVWSSKQRIAVFLSAMRHFRVALEEAGYRCLYTSLEDEGNSGSLERELARTLNKFEAKQMVVLRPGDHRVKYALEHVSEEEGVPLEMLEDEYFLSTPEDFKEHAAGRKQLRMEYFYREMRKRYGVLMEDGKPVGGKWNFDASNRGNFGKKGPQGLPERLRFEPDAITREVIRLVEERFTDHPGRLETFGWAVTREQALEALAHFVEDCLSSFGRYQDAMWEGEPFLYHSLLSSALNLKLLNPREVMEAAERAYREGTAPIEAVEGFVRQILGWREYVRGIYWLLMPEYLERNALEAKEELPGFYWTGATDMACLRDAISQTLETGYAHHIQRLMVTGLFALLYGVDPRKVHEWYLAVFVDAVEWVELPNTLGMSQYGDGGVMASKPYVASGKYIQRMSNYCAGCRYDPAEATGERACPFTTLYWDFLMRHEEKLRGNPRMTMQLRNAERLTEERRREIRERARIVGAKVRGETVRNG